MADCSELSKLVLEMTEAISEMPDVRNVDDALGVMRESVPTMTREEYVGHISDAVESKRRKSKVLADTFRDIKAEVGLDKGLRKSSAELERYLETGQLPPVKKTKPAPTAIQELRKTKINLAKWVKNADQVAKQRLTAELTGLQKDIAKGKAGKKRIPETEFRQPIKDLNDKIKALKKTVADGKAITKVVEQIAIIRKHLTEGTYPSQTAKAKAQASPQMQKLRELRDGLKKQLDKTEAAKKSKRDRLEPETIKRLKKEITVLEDHILGRTLPEKATRVKVDPTQAVKELQDKRKALKKELTKTEPALINRLKKNIATLEERIKTGDIFPTPKEVVTTSKEVQKLTYQQDRLKQEIRIRIKAAEPKSVWGYAKEGANAFRAFMTGGEFSLVLRQGGITALTRPKITAKAMPKMFKAFMSEDASHKINDEILNRPNAPLYAKSGLQISPIDGSATLSSMEELYMSHWIEKIPVMKNFQRAGLTFLNEIRADSFDVLNKSLPITNKGAQNQNELDAIANYVNAATGRGKLGAFEKSAEGLNTLFFAPRYVTSRFQMLLGEPMWGGTKATRKIVAKEYARFAVGASAVIALGALSGAEIEWDPRSTDFGKMKFGNTRIDPWFGISQVTVLTGRLISGESKKGSGEIVPLRPRKYVVAGKKDKLGYAAGNLWDVTSRFVRGKLSPMASSTVDLIFTGENLVGEEVTVGTLFGKIDEEGVHPGNLYVPLAWRDIYDAYVEQGVAPATAMSMLTYFGTGLQTYESKSKKKRYAGKKVIR